VTWCHKDIVIGEVVEGLVNKSHVLKPTADMAGAT
jgi:hypothetical protein